MYLHKSGQHSEVLTNYIKKMKWCPHYNWKYSYTVDFWLFGGGLTGLQINYGVWFKWKLKINWEKSVVKTRIFKKKGTNKTVKYYLTY
jgi:hypothetical protein